MEIRIEVGVLTCEIISVATARKKVSHILLNYQL